MSVNQLKQEIKARTFKPFYLLFGDEAYMVRYYKKLLSETILNGGSEMNFSLFSGKGTDFSKVLSLALSLPFFSEYRLIVLENTGFFSSQNEVSDLLLQVPSTCILIFVETEVDKRNRLYKTISKTGLVVEFERETEESLSKWILSYFKKNEVTISKPLALYLIEKIGNDMDSLWNEMEKLLSYVYEKKELEKADIDFVCPNNLQDQVFKLIECIGKKERETALQYYYDLLDLREASLKILYLIIRHFKLLLSIKTLAEEGRSSEAASLLKISPYSVKHYVAQSHNFSSSVLLECLDFATSLENDIKQGRIQDKIAVETLIIKYSK